MLLAVSQTHSNLGLDSARAALCHHYCSGGIGAWWPQDSVLIFADNVIILASSNRDPQLVFMSSDGDEDEPLKRNRMNCSFWVGEELLPVS